MSHQTGIKANAELKGVFAEAKNGDIRLMKIVIENEELTIGHQESVSGSLSDDWDLCVRPHIKVSSPQPCYFLVRLDSRNNMGYEWVYIAYSPDQAPVREKMLYAATRATLKQEFGTGQITDEMFCTTPEEATYAGYERHKHSELTPAPLTFREEELKDIRNNEVTSDISVDTKHQTMTGLSFPLTSRASDALLNFKNKLTTYVQLEIVIDSEQIDLSTEDNIDVPFLASLVPDDKPRYHLFNFTHTFEGDVTQSTLFIYSMPGYKCSVKERMLYSSCKGPLVDYVEQTLQITLAKKLEVDSASDLTEDNLYDEVHPKKDIIKKKFDRPKPPGRTNQRSAPRP